MSVTEIKKVLLDYGLTPKEVAVYLALLKLGEGTVQEISLAAKLKRTTVYLIVEKLEKKGLTGSYKAKYGTRHVASPPRGLINHLESIKASVASVLPQLEALRKKEQESAQVSFYRGRLGYKTVLEDSLTISNGEILYIGSAQDLNEVITEEYAIGRYIPERVRKETSFRQLVLPDVFSKNLKENDTQELRQTRFITPASPFTANMLIYGSKVAYFSSKRELACVLIESADIAQMEREKFSLLWQASANEG